MHYAYRKFKFYLLSRCAFQVVIQVMGGQNSLAQPIENVTLPVPDSGIVEYLLRPDPTGQIDRYELNAKYIDFATPIAIPDFVPPRQMFVQAYSRSFSFLQVCTAVFCSVLRKRFTTFWAISMLMCAGEHDDAGSVRRPVYGFPSGHEPLHTDHLLSREPTAQTHCIFSLLSDIRSTIIDTCFMCADHFRR